MPTLFTDLALDPVTGDIDLRSGGFELVESNQISLRQRLLVRFSVWQGDWYFDQSLGFPYRLYISKKVIKAILDKHIKDTVNLEPDVLQITDFRSVMHVVSRSYEAYFTVTTAEGDTVNLAFIGSDAFVYPTPSEKGATLCGDDGWITWGNKLYYLINFRLPNYGDATWANVWAK